MVFHGRVADALIALAGLAVIVLNKWFADASATTSRDVFGVDLRPGTRAHRFNRIYSRTLVIVVGTLSFVAGTLGVLGVDWRSWST